MADSLMGQTGGGLLIRTAAVTIVVMGFFGVATGALPVRCLIGGACGTTAPAAGTIAAPQQAAAAPAGIEQVAVKAAPTLSSNDVIAATFAQLKVELKPPGTAPTSPTQVATTRSPSVVTNADTGLSKRVVRALGVRPDGTPVLGTSLAEAYAAPAPLRPSPAVAAAASIGAGQTPQIADVTPADLSPAGSRAAAIAAPTTRAPTPVSSGVARVAGQGANVRSSPGKSGKVLFALRGGAQVTIVETRRGWAHIKDDQGRAGWLYADGLTRS